MAPAVRIGLTDLRVKPPNKYIDEANDGNPRVAQCSAFTAVVDHARVEEGQNCSLLGRVAM